MPKSREIQPIDDQTQLLDDMSEQWGEARELVESFANKYYLKEPLTTGTAQELAQAGLEFGSRVALLWVKGFAMTAKEGARMAEVAFKAAREE